MDVLRLAPESRVDKLAPDGARDNEADVDAASGTVEKVTEGVTS